MKIVPNLTDMRERIPPSQLPASPDDIDLDRIVWDPEYRETVKRLLRRWQAAVPGHRKTLKIFKRN